jgi:integrase
VQPVLTRDNPHLTRPTIDASGVSLSRAVNCTEHTTSVNGAVDCTARPSDRVLGFVRDSLSATTRRAYIQDLDHFLRWGGVIPAQDAMVANYLASHANSLSVATLERRIASIAKAHVSQSYTSPTRSELVRATLRGIKRARGTAQKQAKPLIKEDLFSILGVMGSTTIDARDQALLLLGFAGGFRRSELVAVNCTDIEQVRQGIVVHIRRSKTDQEGAGRKIGIPFGRGRWCVVTALRLWIERARIEVGPVFRGVDRHGHVLSRSMSGAAVSFVVRKRAAAIGLDPLEYSGHSLRAGLATSAAAAGVSSWKIRQQTGHASDAMLARYIRAGELFVDNAAGALL